MEIRSTHIRVKETTEFGSLNSGYMPSTNQIRTIGLPRATFVLTTWVDKKSSLVNSRNVYAQRNRAMVNMAARNAQPPPVGPTARC